MEPGSKISLGRVLALKSGGKFSVGQPYLENVAVHAEVLEELKGPKASTKHELHESACSLHAWARAGTECWEGLHAAANVVLWPAVGRPGTVPARCCAARALRRSRPPAANARQPCLRLLPP